MDPMGMSVFREKHKSSKPFNVYMAVRTYPYPISIGGDMYIYICPVISGDTNCTFVSKHQLSHSIPSCFQTSTQLADVFVNSPFFGRLVQFPLKDLGNKMKEKIHQLV